MQILIAIAVALGALGAALFAFAIRSYRRRRWMGTARRGGGSAFLFSLSALSATLGASTHGYAALTREEVAMTVTTTPTGPRTFQAQVEFPDGRDTTLAVQGDQFLVDAHILKWRYVGNLLGLHTQYELDRLTGRYIDIEDERALPRTVHSLKADKPFDLFELAQRYALLALLVDTEYGSATYTEVDRPARFQVLVSTTGLLLREVDSP